MAIYSLSKNADNENRSEFTGSAFYVTLDNTFAVPGKRLIGEKRLTGRLSLSINPRVDKRPQPLMFNPALTTCASERIKTRRFSHFAGFAARERMRERRKP